MGTRQTGLEGATPLPDAAENDAPNMAISSLSDDGPPVDMEVLLEVAGGSQEEAQALAEFFLGQAQEMLNNLTGAIDRSCLKEIEAVAHKLAGSSVSCGMIAMAVPLRKLEEVARSERPSPTQARLLNQEARRRFQQTEQYLGSCFSDPQGLVVQ